MYNIYKYAYLTTPSQNTPPTKPKSDSEAPKVDFKSLLEQKHLDRDELHGVVVHGKKMSDDIVNSVTDSKWTRVTRARSNPNKIWKLN